MKKIKIGLFVFIVGFVCQSLIAQKNTGKPTIPIRLGYVTFMEAHIWAVSSDVNFLKLTYWDVQNPKKILTAKLDVKNKSYGFVEFICSTEPGKNYKYNLWKSGSIVNKDSSNKFKTPELWRWRNPAPDFSIAFGSCNYLNQTAYDRPGKPYGDTQTNIFNQIASKNPNLFLWLGDNIYLREPDWGTETGIYNRYLQFAKDTGVLKLFKKCPNYAIWDDHDFGPNDGNGSFPNKSITLKAFNEFWSNPITINPAQGNYYWFEYEDAQFFMLDNRYNRVVNNLDSTKETILGTAQLEWLKGALAFAPKNDFKIICVGGQFLNTAAMFENYANWAKERTEIINWIDKNKIKNVIFLTGDRHFSELSMLKTPNGISIYDFTASPLTSSNHSPAKTEVNANRVDGTLFDKERNFGMLQFKTIDKKRNFEFILYNKFGIEIWRKLYQAE